MAARSHLHKPIYLGAATRTPIGKFGGALKRFSAGELAALTLKEALRRAPDAQAADFVFLGHGRQAGQGPNTARQATCLAGLGDQVPAITVNQACASGLASILAGVEKLSLERAHSVWAGGVESMSNTPYLLPQVRWGQRMGSAPLVDGMVKDGFFCPMSQMLMGETVENFLVPEFQISRQEQDAYALRSQQNAERAWTSGAFKAETFEVPSEAKHPALNEDEHRRGDTTAESLAKLAPVFSKTGTITAGNSSGITDGAAWVHLSRHKGPHAQVEILDYEVVALDPRRMGLGPVSALQNLFQRQGLVVSDIEAFEVNEAFAAQVIACQRTLQLPEDKVNARGGGISIGHPIGATGTRITVTLTHRLAGKSGALGVATLCVSGGMGVALLVRAL